MISPSLRDNPTVAFLQLCVTRMDLPVVSVLKPPPQLVVLGFNLFCRDVKLSAFVLSRERSGVSSHLHILSLQQLNNNVEQEYLNTPDMDVVHLRPHRKAQTHAAWAPQQCSCLFVCLFFIVQNFVQFYVTLRQTVHTSHINAGTERKIMLSLRTRRPVMQSRCA